MSERPPHSDPSAASPATAPLGDAALRLGEHVGRSAALAIRRLEGMAAAGLARARAATAPNAAQSPAPRESGVPDAEPAAATVRAEELVSRAGAQLGALAVGAGERLRKAAALAREEAEDIWAEAQHLRQRSHHDPNKTP